MTALPFVCVEAVMTTDIEIVEGMASVEDALSVMRAKNISSLVVSRRDERDEYGLVLVSDIAREIISRNRPVARVNVYEIMAKPAPALDAQMDIKYAIRHMTRFALSHCLVLRGRDLVGIVTLRDMTVRYLENPKG